MLRSDVERYIKPGDEKTVLYEVETKPDERGRQRFCRWWWNEHFHAGPQYRAQVFCARLEEYRTADFERGMAVHIVANY